MPPSEADQLTSYLIAPAPLHQVISFDKFVDRLHLPARHRENPQLKSLYRDLERQQAARVDHVRDNIEEEVATRGKRIQRAYVKARNKRDHPKIGVDELRDIRMEAELFGDSTRLSERERHNLQTLKPAMDKACEDIEAENEALEAEIEKDLETIKSIVGDLSDLRYGKFAKSAGGESDVGQDFIESMEHLRERCDDLKDKD